MTPQPQIDPIPEDLKYRYEKACAVVDTSHDVDLESMSVGAAVVAMATSTKELIERIARLEKREKGLREALIKARKQIVTVVHMGNNPHCPVCAPIRLIDAALKGSE